MTLVKINSYAAHPRAILLVGGNSLFAAVESPGNKLIHLEGPMGVLGG
jgi:hypothetical protein